tara:strand:+ start:133 stop:330 length:198 start_codon:yes stop_codon:yes gene_type:complete
MAKDRPYGASCVLMKWTWDECILLKKYYGTMPVEDLIKHYFPNRKPNQIYKKVSGLRKRGWTFDN